MSYETARHIIVASILTFTFLTIAIAIVIVRRNPMRPVHLSATEARELHKAQRAAAEKGQRSLDGLHPPISPIEPV